MVLWPGAVFWEVPKQKWRLLASDFGLEKVVGAVSVVCGCW